MNIYDDRVWTRLESYSSEKVHSFFFKYYGFNGSGRIKRPKDTDIYFDDGLLIHRVEIFGIEYFFSYRYKNLYLPELKAIVTSQVILSKLQGNVLRVQKRHALLSDADVDLHVTLLLTGID